MWVQRTLAPAKINLWLRILGRRLDGYHDVSSLMAPLNWGDDVSLAVSDRAGIQDNLIHCTVIDRPELSGMTNLAARAAASICKALNWRGKEINITIDKRIWVGAGLGGGSSDAAAAILLLQRYAYEGGTSSPLPEDTAQQLAAELGADVPFFLSPTAKIVSGTGIDIVSNPTIEPITVLLVNPGVHLSTPGIYSGLALDRGARLASVSDTNFARSHTKQRKCYTLEDVALLAHNDLEQVAIRHCPYITEIKQQLTNHGAAVAMMSGSGSTVFGLFPKLAAANAAEQGLRHAFESQVGENYVGHSDIPKVSAAQMVVTSL